MSDPADGRQGEPAPPAFSIASLSTLKSNLFDLAMGSLFLNILGLELPMALLQVYDRILPYK